MNGVTLATVVLAIVTAGLVVVTSLQVWLARSARDQVVRPLLADPMARPKGEDPETIQFGAPGRATVSVPPGCLYFSEPGQGAFQFSVAFENIGTGVAIIHAAHTEPAFHGDVYVSRKFAPVGSLIRVNVSVLGGMVGSDRFADNWWAMDGISVIIDYTDASGRQRQSSRAEIRQYATQGPFVQHITVTMRHWLWRNTVTTGSASY